MNKNSTSTKKILLLTPSYPPEKGGVASVVSRQVAELELDGYEVFVITKKAMTTRNESNVFEIEIKTRGFPFYASAMALPSKGQVVVQMNNIISRIKPDIIISHCWMAWNTDLLIDFYIPNRTKVGVYSHCLPYIERPNSIKDIIVNLTFKLYRLWKLKTILNKVDFLLCLGCKSSFRFGDVQLAQSLGVETYIVENSRKRIRNFSLQSKEDLIVSVSDFTDLKNPKELIRALKNCRLGNWKVKIYGVTKGRYLDTLKEEVNKLTESSNIDLCVDAPPSEIEDALLRAKVFVQTSRTECKPLVISEARDAGCYVISSNVGDLVADPMTSIYRDSAHLQILLRECLEKQNWVSYFECRGDDGSSFVNLVREIL